MPATIEWLLTRFSPDAVQLLAGAGGRLKPIASVNIMDNPDTIRWLKPDELILTTGYLFLDDTEFRRNVIPELVGRGCAGMGFVLGRYFDAPPAEMVAQAEELDFPLFSIPYETSLAEVAWLVYQHNFQDDLSEAERLAVLQRRFGQAALREWGIGGMVSDIVKEAGCPVLLLDEELDLVGYDEAGFAGLKNLVPLQEGTPVFSRHVNRNIAETVRKQSPDTLRQTLPHEDGVVGFVVFPLYDSAGVLGYLCLVEVGKELSAAEIQFVQGIRPILGMQLLRKLVHGRARNETRQEFMRFLLSPNPHAPAELKAQCELYGLDYRPARVCLLFRLEEHVARSGRQRKALSETAYAVVAETLQKAHHNHFSLPFQNNLITFLFVGSGCDNGDTPALALDQATAIHEHLGKMDIPSEVGVSKCYGGAETIRLVLDQALEAIRLGRELEPGTRIHPYRRYQLPHILAESMTPRQARELHYDTMGVLERHDRTTGQDLARVMQVFLECGLRATETATRLGIHRNTLSSRLEKIETVIGRDPRDFSLCLEMTAGMYAGTLLNAGLLERDAGTFL